MIRAFAPAPAERIRLGILATSLVLFSFSARLVAQTPTQLTTESEVQDGEIRDLATQYNATSSAGDKRAWVAHGRVRSALRLSDRSRMSAEDRVFSLSTTGTNQNVFAVEVDDTNGYLYTLTDAGLYRETIAGSYSPAAPGDERFLTLHSGLVPTPLSAEAVQDVKLISAGYVLLLTNLRPIVLKSTSSVFDFLPPASPGGDNLGQALELFDQIGTSNPYLYTAGADATFDALEVSLFYDATVSVDADGRTVAYLLAAFTKYPASGRLSVVRPYCQVLVLCDLDASGSHQAPIMDANTGSAVGFAYWDPYNNYTGSGGVPDLADLRARNAYEVVTRIVGTQTQAFVACGAARQLVQLSAPFAAGAMTELATLTVDSSQNLFEMHKDRSDADLLHIAGSSRFYSYDVSTASGSYVDEEWLTIGGLGDTSLALLPNGSGGTTTSLWVVGANNIDHMVKVYDISASQPALLDEIGFLWRSDGGAALDFDNVYVPTWGGVRHYKRTSGVWEFDSHQPAEIVESGVKKQFATEHIDIGDLGSSGGRIFLAGNTLDAGVHRSGVLASRLDLNNRLQAVVFHEIQPSWFSWTVSQGDLIWCNDVAFLSWSGHSFVLADATFASGSTHETGLVAFRWDVPSQAWVFSGAAKHTTSGGLSNTITTSTTGGVPVAFVAGDYGVASYDLSGITGSTPSIAARTLLTNSVSTRGMVAARGRLIVFYDASGQTSQTAIYNWTTTGASAGTINTTPVATYSSTSIVAGWGRSWRARYDPINSSSGNVYVGNEGVVYRLLYTATTPSLTHDATWSNDNTSALQDCRIYDFGGTKRILAAKDAEGFAWVNP